MLGMHWWRWAFGVAFAMSVLALLSSAGQVLAFKVWVASWLPGAAIVDAMNASGQADKWVHGLMFAAMGALAVGGWLQPQSRWWVLAGVCAWVPGSEWLQQFVPGRDTSWADGLADMVGLCAGVAFAAGLLNSKAKIRA